MDQNTVIIMFLYFLREINLFTKRNLIINNFFLLLLSMTLKNCVFFIFKNLGASFNKRIPIIIDS